MTKETKETKEIHLNPIDEKDLEDKRNIISENCFVELDIALKGYIKVFGQDMTSNEISLLHSTLAYVLSNHTNEHKLSNVDIDSFKIPNTPFKNKEGDAVDNLEELKENESLHFLTNMIINSKSGFIELAKSGYFEDISKDIMIEKQSLMFQMGNLYDRSILLMNNKYTKVVLNINNK